MLIRQVFKSHLKCTRFVIINQKMLYGFRPISEQQIVKVATLENLGDDTKTIILS